MNNFKDFIEGKLQYYNQFTDGSSYAMTTYMSFEHTYARVYARK